MGEIANDLWDLISTPTWTPSERLADCRQLWRAHQHRATTTAAFAANIAWHEFSGGTAERPVAVQPVSPPSDVLAAVGPDGPALARETWRIVASLAAEADLDIDDPALEDDFRKLSREVRGREVFLFVWWAAEAIAQIAESDPDHFETRLGEIGRRITQLSA